MNHFFTLVTRCVLAFIISAFLLFPLFSLAQTDPAPQALPFSQNFSSFTGSSTIYPAGFQGWTVAGSLGTAAATAAPSGDQALIAGVTNASTVAFVGDMVSKMGILSTGSNIRAICLAINTTGTTNVLVTFTAATQAQLSGGRVDELDLQYRIGTSGSFTTVSGASYQNNALSTINTGTAASNAAVVAALLPAACDNQAVVELRWIVRDVTGSGNRPSFSITNISAQHATVTNYYSKATGNLDATTTWGVNTDGTGTSPANFTTSLQEFHISNGNPGNLGANWTVSGSSSKIVVDGTNFTIPSARSVTGTIDVNAGRTLTITNTTLPTFGTLDSTSTIYFKDFPSLAIPLSPVYGSIILDNTTIPVPGANGAIVFGGNLTLQNLSSLNGSSSAAYSLIGRGALNQTISANGLNVTVRNIDMGNTNIKPSGIVALAANTNITVVNSLLMNITGPSAQFVDGGNTLTVGNNIDLTGNAAGYNFTGTIITNGTSGSQNFRGGGSSSNPCVAAINNLVQMGGDVAIRPTAGGGSLTIKGNMVISAAATGSFIMNPNTLYLGGDLTDSLTTETIGSTTGSVIQFNGTGTQHYLSFVTAGNTVNNVTMNNTGGGLTLATPLNITDTLTLSNGKINTGTQTLYLGAAGIARNASASSYVNGNLSKAMPGAGVTSMFFETGDVTYAPLLLTFGSTVSSGSIAVHSVAGSHPQIATAYVNTSDFVNRYWSIVNSGVTTPTINLALSYNAGDMTGSSNSDYFIRHYDGVSWTSAPSVVNTTSATAPLLPYVTSSTGIAGTAFSGDYVAGQPSCATPSAGTALASPVALCVSGSSSLSLTGASSGSGITYQWQSSPDGSSWTAITGATNVSYNTPIITATTYYRSVLSCLLTGAFANSVPVAVTVNPLPSAILGPGTVCAGNTTALIDASAGGTWSSSDNSVATAGVSSGMITGVAAGVAQITYTLPTGCITTATMMVLPLPAAISGATQVCTGLTTTLADGGGGTWSSGHISVATIGSLSGIATGISAGTATITYTLPTGCITTTTFTVNALPPAISGATDVCAGSSVLLTDATAGGSWTSSDTSLANIDSVTGTLIGVSAGSVMITYTLGTSCLTSRAVTINALPAAITGPASVCVAGTIMLSDAGSGIWESSDVSIASVGSVSGIVTGNAAGGVIITYVLPTGCQTTTAITVDPLPAAITGLSAICDGNATLLTDAGGGAWGSSDLTIATIGTASGTVTAVGPGAINITYTLPTGCMTSMPFTVNPLPAPISGPAAICRGLTANFSDATVGGTWSSSDASVASVIVSSGLVTAVSDGSTMITYALPTGCNVSSLLTVNPRAEITGASNICSGTSASLFNTVPGGTWNSSNLSIASVGSATGTVSGIALGDVTISYELLTGCLSTSTITIIAIPAAISGSTNVCTGSDILLTDAGGGVWSSSDNTIAIIDSVTGILTGITAGAADITYSLGTGCETATVITVNAAPASIGGLMDVCLGSTTTLTDVTLAGTWSSSDAAIANIGSATGIVSGLLAGSATITYLLSNGCTATANVTVNPLSSIGGSGNICMGMTGAFSDSIAGGIWSSGNIAVATIGSASGIANSISVGTTNITYTLPTGCIAIKTVSINALPAIYTMTGGGNYCAGGSGVTIGLSGSESGINYQLYDGFSTTSTPFAGTGSMLDFGFHTLAGAYSVVATNASTGCVSNMLGSSLVAITPTVVPSVSIGSSTGTSICNGTVSTFTAAAANGGTTPHYVWHVNGVVVGADSTSYTYAAINSDVVTVKLLSNATCAIPDTAAGMLTMSVLPLRTPFVSIGAVPGNILCNGSPVTIVPSSINGGSAPVYSWIVNGINMGTSPTYAYFPNDSDRIVCRLHSSYLCTTANDVLSPAIHLSVNEVYLPIVSIEVHPGSYLMHGQADTLNAIVSDGGPRPSYQWMVNGSPITGATSATFVQSSFQNTDSVVCLVKGTGICGMQTFNGIIMHVAPEGVSDQNGNADKILISPNPNNASFHVTGSVEGWDKSVRMIIVNALGQPIYEKELAVENGTLNGNVKLPDHISDGVYFIDIFSSSKKYSYRLTIIK